MRARNLETGLYVRNLHLFSATGLIAAGEAGHTFIDMEDQDTPAARHIKSTDFEDLRAGLTGWDHEYDLLSQGFSGDMLVNHGGHSQISRVRWGGRIRYRGTSPTGTFGAGVTISQTGEGKWLGRNTQPNDVVIQKPGEEAEFIAPETWLALVFSVPEPRVKELYSVYVGSSETWSEALHGAVRLSAADAAWLRSLSAIYFRSVFSGIRDGEGTQDREGITKHLLAEQLEKAFVLSLVRAGHKNIRVPTQTEANAVVRRAEELVRMALPCPTGVTDLCAELGMAERSLHVAFQKSVGKSPAAWLRTIRLNQVYKILRETPPSNGQIKRVAREHGFIHLGHFAAKYAALFGEKPSETLGRGVRTRV